MRYIAYIKTHKNRHKKTAYIKTARIKIVVLRTIRKNTQGETMKIFREMARNTAMGVESIDNMVEYIDCDKLKNLVLSQKEVLEDFYQKAASELSEKELEDAKTTPVQRIMLKAGVKMNAGINNKPSHLASMLIDGYNMGIESVQKCVNELAKDGTEVPDVAKDLMKVYDKNIKALRAFL